MKNRKPSITLLAALTAVLIAGSFKANAQDAPITLPLKSVPTFSTANIARQGHFYVGGKWVGEPGKEYMRGAMYVEVWVPKTIRYKYPIVFVQSGGGETNVALLQTPDGRPGWAYDFVNRGYTVYKCDFWTQGPYFLQMLRMLEGYDLKSMGYNKPDTVHLMVETIKKCGAELTRAKVGVNVAAVETGRRLEIRPELVDFPVHEPVDCHHDQRA